MVRQCRCRCPAQNDESGNPTELLHRNWDLAPRSQVCSDRASRTACCGLCRAERQNFSRRWMCTQDSRRRQDVEESACSNRASRKSAISRVMTSIGWRQAAGRARSGAPPASRAAWTPAHGFRRRYRRGRWAASISPRAPVPVNTKDTQALEATLARLSEMVCRRLREQELHARTLQLKLRYSDFRTFTRARTLEQPSSVDAGC